MATRVEIEQRIAEVETQLAGARTPRRVAAWAAARWNVSPRQGRKYVERVKERWAADGTAEDRRSLRDHMRASLNAMCEAAFAKRPDPDLRTALRALDALARLDGLYEERVRIVPPAPRVVPSCPTCGVFDGWTVEELRVYAATGERPDGSRTNDG